jgi:secondary thiamine-phosphate synthase enzyme
MIKELSLRTSRRNEIIDITDDVEELVKGIDEGLVVIHIPHTTAAVTINENADPTVKSDMLRKLSEVFPEHDNYQHAEGNSDSHIKASLIGNSATIILKEGKLVLGTWQGIYFCEFDGPRTRKIIVKY